MSSMTLRRLRFYTKDEDELIAYSVKGAEAHFPMVYIYEHHGSQEEALEAFMPFGSFAMAATGDSYIAFPLRGLGKVGPAAEKLLYRVENGKLSELSDVCKICKNRIKKALSGCDPCEGLKTIPQLFPMIPKNIKGKTEVAEHAADKRRKRDVLSVSKTKSNLV